MLLALFLIPLYLMQFHGWLKNVLAGKLFQFTSHWQTE